MGGFDKLSMLATSDKSDATKLFKTVLQDLIADPSFSSRVRRVKLHSARMQRVTSNAPGIESILLAIGYERENGELVLPETLSPEQVAKVAQSMLQQLESLN